MEKVIDLQKKRNEKTFNKLLKAAQDARAEISADPWPTINTQKQLIKHQQELLMKIYAIVHPSEFHLETQYPTMPVDICTEAITMVDLVRQAFKDSR